MDLRQLAVVACVLVLLMGACSDEPATSPGALSEAEQSSSEPKDGSKSGGKKDGAEPKRSDGGGVNKAGGGGPASKKQGSGGGGAGGDGDGGRTAAAWPAAGRYVYGQSGFEEFCQATCDRRDLPDEQPITISVKDRKAERAVVVSEARASDSRTVRTTTRYTPERALITEVHTSFEYETFEFQDSYHPEPPVESLRFPLRPGMSWSGKWRDKTSGEYSIAVKGRDTVNVGGGSVEAFRIATRTTFKGQFQGRSDVTVWFDPSNKVVVKVMGDIDVKSSFGRYHSEFSTLLRSGPGY